MTTTAKPMLSHRTKESESSYSSGTDNHAEGDSPYRLSFVDRGRFQQRSFQSFPPLKFNL